MIKNYFKTAFRTLLRNKNYTLINIAGLAAGIAVCVTIFTIIQFHAGFDNFHSKKDRIYRVLTEYHHNDSKDIFYGRGVPFALPKGLRTAFAQIEQSAIMYADFDDQVLVLNDNGAPAKKFKEERGVLFTEPSFFSIFDFPLLQGSYASLKDPNNVILTKETAEKYFGDWKAAVGKSIKLNNSYLLNVSGVLGTIPANSDFQLKMAVAYGTGFTKDLMASADWDGTNSNFGYYLLLPKNTAIDNFNMQLRAYVKKAKSPNNKDSHIIQPLRDVHYDTLKTGNYGNKTISHEMVNALWLIAAFILLIACINFINLSTAQAVNRAKEVGVRKVLGSNKWQLKMQFNTETFLIVFSAVVLAAIITWVSLPSVSAILDISLSFNIISNPAILLFLLVVTIVVTALAGIYPSLVLSGFNPITALKSKLTAKASKGISLRRGLVVFQFIIAQVLIIGTLVIVKQMNYFSNQPLGFDKSAIVNIPFPRDSVAVSKLDFLKKQLSAVNGVQRVTFASNTPVEDDNDNWTNFNFDHAVKETDFYAINKFTDDQYVPAYQLPLVAGRNIGASDTIREFLVNESLVKSLGLKNPNDVLNKEISLWGRFKGPVVGVLKDFNARSFRRDLAPVLITSFKNQYSEAGIKLATTGVQSAMQAIEKVWNQVYPDFVFEYKFLDDKVDSFYKQENQLAQLYKIFAVIAVFLSCLGLYGLVSFMAVQRIKEVGIRKVLGASAGSIVYLFSKEFVILITIAFVIASPIAWYFMHQWLQAYPFRITISWWLFIAGGAASVLIALVTVSFQAIKAALANPVKSLRTE